MTHDISGVIVLLQTRIEKDPGEKKKLFYRIKLEFRTKRKETSRKSEFKILLGLVKKLINTLKGGK